MDPITGLALSSLAGSVLGVGGQMSANAANAATAERQMQFQAAQSSTQYQRGVADLRAAGLNPLLAVTNGMSAGSASGASYQEQNPMAGVQSGVGEAVSTALQARRSSAEIASLESSAESNKAQAVKALSEAGLAPSHALKLVADTKLSEAMAKGTAVQTVKTGLEGDILKPKALGARVIHGAARYGLNAVSKAAKTVPDRPGVSGSW